MCPVFSVPERTGRPSRGRLADRFLIGRALDGPLLPTVRAAERMRKRAGIPRVPPASTASNGLVVGVSPKNCEALGCQCRKSVSSFSTIWGWSTGMM